MYSFQLVMNAKTEVATRPGATSGSRMRTNAPRRVEPSTIAASSSSFGIPMMKPRNVHTENGQRKGQVGPDHAAQLVDLVVAGEHDVQRDDEAGARQHLDADHQDDEELAAGEAVLRERDRREERERHRDRDDDEPMIRLFFTSVQKNGVWIASPK